MSSRPSPLKPQNPKTPKPQNPKFDIKNWKFEVMESNPDPNKGNNGHANKNGSNSLASQFASKMQIDPNYKIEDDEELWIKLQFVECLRENNYEEAEEYLEELLEAYPKGNEFMKEFK